MSGTPSGPGGGSAPVALPKQAPVPSDEGLAQDPSAAVAAGEPGAPEHPQRQAIESIGTDFPELDRKIRPIPTDKLNEDEKPKGTALDRRKAKEATPPDGETQPQKEAAEDGGKDEGKTPPGDKKPKAAPSTEPTPPKPEPFELAGRKHETREAADHYVKTTEGRLRAATDRLNALQQEVEQLRQGAASPQRPGQEQGQGQSQDQPGDDGEPQEWYDDGALWERYGQLANEKGPMFAGYWLAKKIHEQTKNMLGAFHQEHVAPLHVTEQVRQHANRVMNDFDSLGNLKMQDGSFVYPELQLPEDHPVVMQILETWKRTDPEANMGQRGVHYAVLDWRHYHPQEAAQIRSGLPQPNGNGAVPSPPSPSARQPAPARTNGNGNAPSRVEGSLRAAAEAAAEPMTGSGSPRPAVRPLTRAEQVLKELREAGKNVTTENWGDLGFSR